MECRFRLGDKGAVGGFEERRPTKGKGDGERQKGKGEGKVWSTSSYHSIFIMIYHLVRGVFSSVNRSSSSSRLVLEECYLFAASFCCYWS